MALTLPVRFEATIVDELDIQAETSVYALVDPSATFTEIQAQLDAWLADLDACTDGQIIGSEMEVLPALPDGLKSAAVAGSRVTQTGILDFTATGDTHLWGATIPALSNGGTVISGGKIVLSGGSPANTLYSLLVGGGSAALEWTNATSQALSTFAKALISFRNDSGQLARKSFERAS